jgi:hypothetical protein
MATRHVPTDDVLSLAEMAYQFDYEEHEDGVPDKVEVTDGFWLRVKDEETWRFWIEVDE